MPLRGGAFIAGWRVYLILIFIFNMNRTSRPSTELASRTTVHIDYCPSCQVFEVHVGPMSVRLGLDAAIELESALDEALHRVHRRRLVSAERLN